MKTEVYQDDPSLSSLSFSSRHPVDLREGAWRREVDDGRSTNRIKRSGNMARLRRDSWWAEVTFDTGDKSFLDSIVRRGNQLS